MGNALETSCFQGESRPGKPFLSPHTSSSVTPLHRGPPPSARSPASELAVLILISCTDFSTETSSVPPPLL